MHRRIAPATIVASLLLSISSCTTLAPPEPGSTPDFELPDIGVEHVSTRRTLPPDSDLVRATPAAADSLAVASGFGDPQRRRRRSARRHENRRFSAFGMASFASGDYELHDDALGEDQSSANMYRLRAAGANARGIGGGFDLKVIVPNHNFYRGTIEVTGLDHVDLYGYFLAHASAGAFQMPVRVGPYISNVGAEFKVTGDNTNYTSIGIRVELEPEVVIIDDDGFQASVFSRLSGGVHVTTIDDESTQQDYNSDGRTLGFESGIRLVFDAVSLSASYIFQQTTIRESDPERTGPGQFSVIPRLAAEFDGIQVSMGVKF